MTTCTLMMTATKEQWLELHKRTLDCVRAALLGLSSEELLWEPETTKGETKELASEVPRPFCIAAIVAHLCAVEMDWLSEVQIQSTFGAPRQADWNPETLSAILTLIEEQYHEILEKWNKDRHVLFGLGRVCQHNLYHLAEIVRLRCLREPEWQPPTAGQPGSWEHAADFITDLLVFGDKAGHKTAQP